jgi:hypothetical protein
MRFTAQHPPFRPHPLLRNRHLMTIAPALLPRPLRRAFLLGGERRLFRVDQDAQVLAHCHWQPGEKKQTAPTVIVIHGLEGSSESSHVLMVAQKAFDTGMNAVRLNLRNCGGTIELSPTLYNAGLSDDLFRVVAELRESDGLNEIFAVGFSLAGNIVLKAAGELGQRAACRAPTISKAMAPPGSNATAQPGKNATAQAGSGAGASGRTTGAGEMLTGVVAISPAIDLAAAVAAIEQPQNRIYDRWFVRSLKKKIRQKAQIFPDKYDLSMIDRVDTLRQFDDVYTASSAGYKDASEYYYHASAARVLDDIRVPALVIAAEDDPLIPFAMFDAIPKDHPFITLLLTKYGGHAGFVAAETEHSIFDNYWAENRTISFCQEVANRLQAVF